eukprot:6776936-Pyramimonas_sp.AAC.1
MKELRGRFGAKRYCAPQGPEVMGIKKGKLTADGGLLPRGLVAKISSAIAGSAGPAHPARLSTERCKHATEAALNEDESGAAAQVVASLTQHNQANGTNMRAIST